MNLQHDAISIRIDFDQFCRLLPEDYFSEEEAAALFDHIGDENAYYFAMPYRVMNLENWVSAQTFEELEGELAPYYSFDDFCAIIDSDPNQVDEIDFQRFKMTLVDVLFSQYIIVLKDGHFLFNKEAIAFVVDKILGRYPDFNSFVVLQLSNSLLTNNANWCRNL